jgi:hypothetical protein
METVSIVSMISSRSGVSAWVCGGFWMWKTWRRMRLIAAAGMAMISRKMAIDQPARMPSGPVKIQRHFSRNVGESMAGGGSG